eukprot:CAMPEP_0203941856 /NCGR_PEP_ID=MMETSP0359-20131031/78176_1 /ASSEMBLY_ACC=CAM_ASM_000338 /TAXON_ID=268821 /ORGANISM="Scrippsiella Hangoei, Strain SHTV-5" /LENGTH=115 /DNA_ID=CAMNT_0050872491 /DNA_START=115 /DNA_END=461 /DNA_ORIENTATION=-
MTDATEKNLDVAQENLPATVYNVVDQENLSDEGKCLDSAVEDLRRETQSSGAAPKLRGVRRGHHAVNREQAEDGHHYAEPSSVAGLVREPSSATGLAGGAFHEEERVREGESPRE